MSVVRSDGVRRETPLRRLWSLTEDVLVELEPDRLVVVSRWGETVLPEPDPVVRWMLQRMTLGPVALSNVATTEGARRGLRAAMDGLQEQLSGSMEHSLVYRESERPVISVRPVAPSAPFTPGLPGPGTRVCLSRQCVLTTDGSVLHADSSAARHRVLLHWPGARVLGMLAAPVPVADLADELGESLSLTAMLVGYLLAAGVVLEARPGRIECADAAPAATGRCPAELGDGGDGRRTDRFAGTAGADRPVPADRPPVQRRLPSVRSAPSAVLDLVLRAPPGRRGLARAPRLADLGTLLHRSARILAADRHEPPPGTGPSPDRLPAAAADLFEDGILVVVGAHPELRSAAYVYDAGAHALMDAGQPAEAVDDVLDGARRAAGLVERPALVLLVMTRLVVRSRVPEPVVQATTLLHLGSAQRLIQLAADEIGLATWPLGFDADALVDRVRDLDNPYGTRAVKLVIGRSASPQEEEPAAPPTPGS